MKSILCFGDSNTYGYSPYDGSRYPSDVRWTGVLNELLIKDEVQVIEEGLVGRTTVFEDSFRPGRKGIDYLVPLLETHHPVDMLILMLGTNDCKTIYNASAQVIGLGIERMIERAKRFNPFLKILLISPIHLGEEVWKDGYDPEFNQKSVDVSKGLEGVYRRLAKKYRCSFLAASDVARPSEADQEHLDREGHLALATEIYKTIKRNED
ncbi:MAG: SGNH/GDSL hydrolase family protein [Lachnospiraceae bacterium]|nr:SGNH/GDSL hydrolase family protein [Lachnospiraceae bacterium]